MKWNDCWTAPNRSAAVLSFGLLGDALLYLVLPVAYMEFGITPIWVGVLLSINRFVRIAANQGVTLAAHRFGLGTIMLLGAILAAGTTLSYGIFASGVALLIARSTWGISFASLRLGSLGFATHGAPEEIGSTLGRSGSIAQIGPLFAVTVGSWMAHTLGARDTFLLLGLLSMIGVPIAGGLRQSAQGRPRSDRHGSTRRTLPPLPTRLGLTIGIMAMIVDGLCIVSLTAMLMASGLDRIDAISAGGILLGVRQAVLTVIPPMAGDLADRFGLENALFGVLVLVIAGLGTIATGMPITGFVIVCTGATAATTLFPGVAVRHRQDNRLAALSSVVTWRDLGAAVGTLLTGSVLLIVELRMLYLLAIGLLLPAVWLLRRRMREGLIGESSQS
jgi:MFS family permease